MQNRLYNDHAALYYLLLSKWEKGKLSVPLCSPLTPHPRLSLCGVPPSIPHINIHKSDSTKPPAGPPGGGGGGTVLYAAGAEGVNLEEESEPDELIKDPNLDRYLKHGRRHTLGAAHNTFFVDR